LPDDDFQQSFILFVYVLLNLKDLVMEVKESMIITVQVEINSPVGVIWKYWTTPADIVKWNYASEDWHTPTAENDLRVGGRFLYRMETKDGSFGFDFSGVYLKVEVNKFIEYTLDDSRKVQIFFRSGDNETIIRESFEAEQTNSRELQQAGWQSILDNFKKYVESEGQFDKPLLE
jgi:uncharacterized protein YndB with AHSA1/START domain